MKKPIIKTPFNQLTVNFNGTSLKIEQAAIMLDGSTYNTGRISLSKTELSELRDYLNQMDLEG